MNSRKGVTVVVPARNAANTIGRTLDSLEIQIISQSVEILVIDNRSDDLTAAIAENHSAGKKIDVRVIVQEKQSGLASSYNIGWKNAKYDTIVFMHADCYLLRTDALESLVMELDQPGVVDVETLPFIPGTAWETMEFWDKVTNARYVGRSDHGYGGRFGAIRKSIMESIDGYDEKRFFSAGEDIDITVRLSRIGIVARSNVTVVHGHEHPKQSTIKYILRKQCQLGQGFGALIRKHGFRLCRNRETRFLFALHGLKLFFLTGLLIPYLRLPCLLGLLLMIALYSGKALALKDRRVVFIPIVVLAQFLSFLGATVGGFVAGRQMSDYK